MLTDVQIAKNAKMEPIVKIEEKFNLNNYDLEIY